MPYIAIESGILTFEQRNRKASPPQPLRYTHIPETKLQEMNRFSLSVDNNNNQVVRMYEKANF